MKKQKNGALILKQTYGDYPQVMLDFYAEQDAGLTLKLWQHFKTEISKQSLHDVWEMEMELLPILIETRRAGIRVDEAKAAELKKEFKKERIICS